MQKKQMEGLSQLKVNEVGIKDVKLGKGVRIVKPVNLYGCEIGNKSFVGPFVEIQKGAKIGKQTRIQSHSFICDKVEIGHHCFISHGVIFVNDTFANGGPSFNPTFWKKTKVGNHVSIGSNSTILPVSICNYVVIGAGSVVTKNIVSPGIYAGNPARKIRTLKKKR